VLDPAAGRTAVSGVGERLGTAAAELHTTRGDTTATHRPDDPALEAVTAGVLDDLAADRDVDVVGRRASRGARRRAASRPRC
jgi:hypothetical protein